MVVESFGEKRDDKIDNILKILDMILRLNDRRIFEFNEAVPG